MLLRDYDAPGPSYAQEYWLLLAKVATRLGKDAYASNAYEKVLGFRPNDVEVLGHLQRLAARHRDDKKSEQLARYGWDRLKRVEDLQQLMRLAWKQENWRELDQWLARADEMRSVQPGAMAQAPDYWYFRAMRRMENGERDAARESLQEILRLRGPDPEVTEAMIWLLLSDKQINHALLDAVVQPYRAQAASPAAVSPPLVEALAAAEQTLGKPVQAAAWYLRSLGTRPADFLWTLALADNMEWAGCAAHANHARYAVLQMFASGQFMQKDVQYPKRLADHVAGLREAEARRSPGRMKRRNSRLQSVRKHWDRLGLGGELDNARFYALQRERERLTSPAWQRFGDAVKNGENELVSAQLSMVSSYLQAPPDSPAPAELLPLSIEDIDRANRWLGGKARPVQVLSMTNWIFAVKRSPKSVNRGVNRCRTRSRRSYEKTMAGRHRGNRCQSGRAPWGGWFETLALTAVVMAASFFTEQQDPFRLEGAFPWPVLAPLLAGLRYGFVTRLSAPCLYWRCWVWRSTSSGRQRPDFHWRGRSACWWWEWLREFRDSWGRRLHRLEGAYQYRAERLEEFTPVISCCACRMTALSRPSPTAASRCARASCVCNPGSKRSMG